MARRVGRKSLSQLSISALRRRAATGLRRFAGSLSALADRIEASSIASRPSVNGAERPVADRLRTEVWLFAGAIAVLLVSRLYRLADFPIYFFCDEAVQAGRASELLRAGFRDEFRQYFPTFFRNGPFFNLSTSVYAQVLPVLLFGKTVFATRAVSAIISVSASIAVALTLRRVFGLRFWWTGALILGITPAWFLHGRTAFETAMATSFYAWFLYLYLRYRTDRPRALYPALVFAALAFYTYSPMQVVVTVTGVLLLLLDRAYHLRNRNTALRGLVLVLLLALPYARFARSHPNSREQHMREIFSYWTNPELTTLDKVATYGREYFVGLSPTYWYDREPERDLVRHRMKGYGHILVVTLPLLALGLLLAAARIRSAPYGAVLLALAAAPAGGALAATGVTRALVFIVPAAILTSVGLDAVATLFARRIGFVPVAVGLFLLLAAGPVAMLGDALSNGPTWYSDYGLGGLQYGARQVFGEVRRLRTLDPTLVVRVSPIWTNGADEVARFFVGEDPNVELHDLDWYTSERRDLGGNSLAVFPADEYRRAAGDPRLVLSDTRTLPFPDGKPGFYFVRLRYPGDIDARMAEERRLRHALVTETAVLEGKTVEVAHSRLDMGPIANVFDADPRTLIRTERVNPAVVEIAFPEPRTIRAVSTTTSSMDLRLTIRLLDVGRLEPAVREGVFERLPPDPTVRLTLDPPVDRIRRIRIEIEKLHSPDIDHVHVREIRFE